MQYNTDMQFFRQRQFVLHYEWIDNKKPRTFLFINSLGTDFRIWDGIVEIVQEHGNILLFDKRGHGLSDTAEHTNGLEDYSDDALALLQHLSINKCVVMGVSVGGMIAQVMAHHHPELIEKLILCDTLSKIGDDAFWNDRIRQIESNGLSGIADGVMQRWFPEPFRQRFPEKVAGYRNMLERCSVKGYIQTCAAIRDADLTGKSKEIKLATLCIVGSEDQSTPPAEVESLSKLISGSRFKQIEGSGHLPCVDNAGKLSALIIDFINE